ncbi:MAG TPA: YpdA family putative bacillithiol disulfide reductase [Gemmatimonadales bacterium]|jgi:thioredoxin reductase (NADPH)
MPDILHTSAVIVGAGPIGLACAISANRRGIGNLVIDSGAIANSIVRYPIGMTFFTTPERLEIGGHPFTCSGAKATREEALKYYRGVVRTEGLAVKPYTRLVGARIGGDRIACEIESAKGPRTISCERLIMATGYFDHANLLDIPGETLPHVSHWFDEPHLTAGLNVVIIGGKNSAVETALQCFRAGARVTLVYRGTTLKPSVKFWLKPDFDNRVAAGEIEARLGAEVLGISPGFVTIRDAAGGRHELPADRVYALTGYHPDFDLLASIGIVCNPETGRPSLDPKTLQTSVPGVYLAGSVGAGRNISEVFIENGRFDGEKIFGDAASRDWADRRYVESPRPVGE